ncbi:uncharacterized protein, partial [Palaemon carinicauda]|uniref:uncharacterized protein n=1 Tax=Palaemon carinicauda TaxID=392227 RepID=UPI0035B67BC0
MTAEDERAFLEQGVCQLCKSPFKDGSDKHRHHDHASPNNNSIGAYCRRCNLSCREQKTHLPVFAHNSSYDLGLILKDIKDKVQISIMTKQGLKIQRMSVGNLIFLDSLAFLGSSLDSLASEYFRDGRKARLTEEMLSGIKNEELRAEIIRGKLSFCYDYIDSLSKLEERQLPPQSAFYNRLKACDLSDEEYKRAQRVWTIAKSQTLKDFLLLYLIVDTSLLGDILIWWHDILYSKYGLDLPHYVSLPSYAFDSFLKMSNIELDHVYDEELYNLIRHNVRGGFTSVVRQSFTANNREINSSFNPDLHQSSYILYLDFNSLYATVMTRNLPAGGIRKLSDEEKDLFLGRGIENVITNEDKGYWLLVTTKMATHRSKKEYLISLPLLQLYMDLGLE